ncbi:hypothetical protein HDU83_003546 [Entophlyctis luteolus]|nr:hypothetical protein HDU83_003546 [Entophlyctis luteolus]
MKFATLSAALMATLFAGAIAAPAAPPNNNAPAQPKPAPAPAAPAPNNNAPAPKPGKP